MWAVGFVLIFALGSWLVKALASGAIILGVLFYVILGALLWDAVAWVWARVNGRPTRGFRMTGRVLGVPLWPWRKVRGWFAGPSLRVATLGELLSLTPREFEETVARSLRQWGYRKVVRCGGAGDLGVDITCIDPNGERIAVQCKRYSPGSSVGSRDIQLFIGMTTTHHRVDRGVFVTTSSFTQPARDLAKRHDIRLIDGHELVRLFGADRPPLPMPEPEEYVVERGGPVFVAMSERELSEIERAVREGVQFSGEIVRSLQSGGRRGMRYESAEGADLAADLLEAFYEVEETEREHEQAEQQGLEAPSEEVEEVPPPPRPPRGRRLQNSVLLSMLRRPMEQQDDVPESGPDVSGSAV